MKKLADELKAKEDAYLQGDFDFTEEQIKLFQRQNKGKSPQKNRFKGRVSPVSTRLQRMRKIQNVKENSKEV